MRTSAEHSDPPNLGSFERKRDTQLMLRIVLARPIGQERPRYDTRCQNSERPESDRDAEAVRILRHGVRGLQQTSMATILLLRLRCVASTDSRFCRCLLPWLHCSPPSRSAEIIRRPLLSQVPFRQRVDKGMVDVTIRLDENGLIRMDVAPKVLLVP